LAHLPDEVSLVSLTGGEPFLEPKRLLDVLSRIDAHGRIAAIVTNGLWSRDWQKARKLLGTAFRLGLRIFSLSLDEYHRPALSDQEAIRLLREAVQLGMEVSLKGTGRFARKKWARVSSHPDLSSVRVRPGWENLETIGTGRGLPADHQRGPSTMRDCGTVLLPLVLPDGRFMACCSTLMFQAKGTWLDVGTVREEPIDRLIDRYRRSFLLAGLFVFGPLGFLRRVGISRRPDQETKCGFCLGWLKDQEICRKVADRLGVDMALKKEIVARVMLFEHTRSVEPCCE